MFETKKRTAGSRPCSDVGTEATSGETEHQLVQVVAATSDLLPALRTAGHYANRYTDTAIPRPPIVVLAAAGVEGLTTLIAEHPSSMFVVWDRFNELGPSRTARALDAGAAACVASDCPEVLAAHLRALSRRRARVLSEL